MALAAWTLKENVLQSQKSPDPHHSSNLLSPSPPSHLCCLRHTASLYFLRQQHTLWLWATPSS